MPFVYHSVPRRMVGEVIYPLNELAAIDPDAYEQQEAKYVGRENAGSLRIPHLDVLWNDVVHCAAIHPHWLFRTLRSAGFDTEPQPDAPIWHTAGRFFEIPLERIDADRAVWYEATDLAAPPEHFKRFDAARYREVQKPSPEWLSYFREMKERNQRPLMFFHIPHVLVAHPIDTRGLRVLTWDQPPGPGVGSTRVDDTVSPG
jgi:hypothetical protein